MRKTNKLSAVISNSAVILGGVLGAGFVSGTEAVSFFGVAAGILPILIFFVAFVFCVVSLTDFTADNGVSDTETLSALCFNKLGTAANLLFIAAYTIVTATMLAGADECIKIPDLNTNFPVFGFLTAAAAAIILKFGINGVKKFNIAAVPIIAVFLVSVLFVKPSVAANPAPRFEAPLYMPFLYALFNTVLSAGILSAASLNSDRKSRLLAAVGSAATIALLLFAVSSAVAAHGAQDIDMPLLSVVAGNPFMRCFGIAAMFLAILSSVVGNAYPIVQCVDKLIGEKTVSLCSVFFVALMLSFLGFDFIVSYCYPAIGLFGLALIARTTCLNVRNKRGRNKKPRVSQPPAVRNVSISLKNK